MKPGQADDSDAAGVLQSCGDVVIMLSNAPDMMLAKRIAHVLVEEHYAACVNLGQAGLSMYMWQGKLEGSEEVPLVIKTTTQRAGAAAKRLRELHPYDVPEILLLPAAGGSVAYLDWVREQASAQPGHGDQKC